MAAAHSQKAILLATFYKAFGAWPADIPQDAILRLPPTLTLPSQCQPLGRHKSSYDHSEHHGGDISCPYCGTGRYLRQTVLMTGLTAGILYPAMAPKSAKKVTDCEQSHYLGQVRIVTHYSW
jgi:hypothetical protein